MDRWLVVPVFAPLVAAVAAFAFPRLGPRLAVLSAAIVSTSAGALAVRVARAGPLEHRVGGWGAPLGIELHGDGLALTMIVMTALVGTFATLHAATSFRPDAADPEAARRAGLFWPLWLFLWAALDALFLSGDVFNVYVALELISLSSVGLIALQGTAVAIAAATRYLFVGLIGSLALLLAIALLYGAHGTLDLSAFSAHPAGPATRAALALAAAGLLLKAAVFPLHSWLPPAHANASAPVSAVLSALVVKAGFYLLLRFWFDALPHATSEHAATLLGGLGAAAVVWGGAQALRQERLKLLVAYSTVAQVGYLLVVFPLAQGVTALTAWCGGVTLAVSHATAKAAMFLVSGNLLRHAGHDRIAGLGPALRARPVSALAFGVASVSIVGLPPSGGFLGKWLLLNAALAGGRWWWMLPVAGGSLLAALYTFRVIGQAVRPMRAEAAAGHPAGLAEWSALALAVAAIVLGFSGSPLLALARAGSALGGSVLVQAVP